MEARTGQSAVDLKKTNRCLVLRTIVENPMISRGALAKATRLSKMSVSNIITEFTEQGIVQEINSDAAGCTGPGRKAGLLDLSDTTAPCIIGVLISRDAVQAALGDLRAHILRTEKRRYPKAMSEEALFAMVIDVIDTVQAGYERRVIGVGVASMGPVNIHSGTILSPANYFGLHDIPIVDVIHRHTNLPVFFSSDSMAAAQAEKLLGEGRNHANFLFLLIFEGIGCGIIMHDRPYAGSRGLAGELGHSSINLNGPICTCGSRGCLESYASTECMLKCIRSNIPSGAAMPASNWEEIWRAATTGNEACVTAVHEYCDALSCALVNLINVFDPELIYLYQHADEQADKMMIELLEKRIADKILARDCRSITVRRASFGEQAALIGTLSLVIAHIFSGELPLQPGRYEA